MKTPFFLAGALLCLPALAQLPAAADPAAAVPSVHYRSVFDTARGVETQSLDWKKANAEVGQFRRGHADVLKWEQAQPPASIPDAQKR